jgi:hypothetical protein
MHPHAFDRRQASKEVTIEEQRAMLSPDAVGQVPFRKKKGVFGMVVVYSIVQYWFRLEERGGIEVMRHE